jgi:3-isopropylmalate/(R)-2-methylmalate dehydratase small subunit
MTPFKRITGIVAPVDRVNVDTDQIIPKQFLKLLQRTGFGKFLFYDWRFAPDGAPKRDFVLNNPRYAGVQILLARANFGCGSSREHAAWALLDYGFRALVAPSYADIFYDNCFKNGILPIVLNETTVDTLFREVADRVGYSLDVDLEEQTIRKPTAEVLHFEIEPFRKKCLLEGLDDIALTKQYEKEIEAYERKVRPDQLVRH